MNHLFSILKYFSQQYDRSVKPICKLYINIINKLTINFIYIKNINIFFATSFDNYFFAPCRIGFPPKRMNIYFSIMLLAFISFNAFAQEEPNPSETLIIEAPSQRQKQNYLYSPRVSITVPHPIGNEAFKKSFVGIYEAGAGLNLMLYKRFFAGITFKNGLLKITENKIPDYNANMSFNKIGANIGSDVYLGSKNSILFSASLSFGQINTKYSEFKCKVPNKTPIINGFRSKYLEPEINIYFLTETETEIGIGFTIAYSLIERNFDPYELCLNDWTQFSKNNIGSINYFSFGFGLYYGFAKKTRK